MKNRFMQYGLLALPLVFLSMIGAAGTATKAQAYWEGGWYGHGNGFDGFFHNFDFGNHGCCSNNYGYGLGLNTIYQIGYNKGYVDASQNNGYNCEVGYHLLTYCNGYHAGYIAGQTSSSNGNEGNNQYQVQQQASNSYSSSQSNPNIKVIVNNYPYNSNNSTEGSSATTAPTNSRPGEQN